MTMFMTRCTADRKSYRAARCLPGADAPFSAVSPSLCHARFHALALMAGCATKSEEPSMRQRASLAGWLVMSVLFGACADSDEPTGPADAAVTSGQTRDGGVSRMDAAVGPTTLLDAGLRDGGATDGRVQDMRKFNYDADAQSPFDALPELETDRFSGELEGAGYRIEVPRSWNGILVMYAHGYVGTVEALRVTTPSIRRHLIEKGYAWAASSYTRNYYDVRAGLEDTNKLALAFDKITKDNGRPLTPTKRYIIGHSMGGHISGAAVEREAEETAKNKVKYQAALPMCGVMGDTELFNYFTAYQVAAQQLAGMPVSNPPPADYAATRAAVQAALFSTFATVTTPAGDKLKAIVKNLTGGARPVFELGFANTALQTVVWNAFGGDGTINGILTRSVTDTRNVEYQLDDDPAQNAEERAFTMQAYKAAPEADANPLRSDGVRWIPVVNGEISVPVLSLHTLGDMYVPFSMQQIYRKRAVAKGNGERLVQRAIRGVSHCEFTYAEQTQAFDALATWEQNGTKPEGDDVLDRATVSSPQYGCKFSTVPAAPDLPTLTTTRAAVACPAAP
jgi:pimeloyl-ACP methyl ester carboxylesterase